MTSAEIRQTFLDFFASKGHLIVPSAPLVVKNDPTLMFTNAGMNQFKDYFLGNRTPPSTRIADTQKCLRVSGKHNDLEEVGHDTYHHTLFEMLGNWSFGDYFKAEAIAWSWELLTEKYGLDKSRLYATVFEGDASENLPMDEESWQHWSRVLPEGQILKGNKKDNFWEMGDTGPCGPCTEIHIDLRTAEERAAVPGYDLVNQGHPQVVEIWNNVFIEFNRMANGTLEKLPARHVDTGMGFERLCMALQGKTSNYDTDVFQPLLVAMAGEAGIRYGDSETTDIALRVLADHIRAISFAVADGQLPGNAKAGYVIRRILRRAIRYYFRYLGRKEPFLHRFVPLLAGQFAGVFPELEAQKGFVARVIEEEESAFLRTLDQGEKRIAQLMAQAREQGSTLLGGRQVFELYDTYGFPLDLTALVARESGFGVDEAGFELEMKAQKERSRKASASETGDWTILAEDSESRFVGYDTLETETAVIKFRKQTQGKETSLQVVLEDCPFYGESGGQVGDTGELILSGGSGQILGTLPVRDTKKENDLIVLICSYRPEAENWLASASGVKARVNATLRQRTAGNHSATHLLHSALREVLGSHIAQKGSLVAPDQLRFDFSHFARLTPEELEKIEARVNEKIRAGIRLEEMRHVPIEDARAMGATALFGDKYGDYVRVVAFDRNYSIELCGGTHVASTGEIGWFTLTGESSVAAGVRRIEALTGEDARAHIREKFRSLDAVSELLGQPRDIVKALGTLMAEKETLARKLEALENSRKNREKERLLSLTENHDGINRIVSLAEAGQAETLRQLCFEIREQVSDLFMVVAAEIEGKPHLAVMLSDSLVNEKGLNAGNLAKELAREIKGGGGGQAFFATAGGQDASGLSRLLEKARTLP